MIAIEFNNTRPLGKPVIVVFRRLFTRGTLEGISHGDKIRFVDRWHAAQWVKGIRANSRRGVLDYKLTRIVPLNLNS